MANEDEIHMPKAMARAELRALFGVSDARTGQLMKEDDFPEPFAALSVGRIWLTDDLLAWAASRGRRTYPVPPSGGR